MLQFLDFIPIFFYHHVRPKLFAFYEIIWIIFQNEAGQQNPMEMQARIFLHMHMIS